MSFPDDLLSVFAHLCTLLTIFQIIANCNVAYCFVV